MKLIILIAVVALASARPDVLEEKKPNVAIVSSTSDADPNGTYSFKFETEDGVKREQEGSSKQITDEAVGAVASGSYSYPGEDGKIISLSFVADENGFQPTGDHLPKPHPAIVRALEQIRRTNEADAKRAMGHHHHA